MSMGWMRMRAFAVAGLACAVAAGCAVNPVTGRRELALVSEAQEIQLGQQSAQEVAQQIGLVDDAALQQYVDGVGQRLARASERPNLPWRFQVVDDPTPNAFALPGGFIFVTRGMMDLMDSEAELAAVLGHEIGHVTARHSVSQISRGQLAQLGLGIGSIFFPEAAQTFGGLAQTGVQLLFLRYGRDAERQSDELGFRYALSEGYEVREMDDVFASLLRTGEAAGRSELPSWLSTHPAEPERIAAARARADTVTRAPLQTGRDAYLARIDGLTYGDDPRQGFFRDGVFLHPELRFRIDFPQGWRTQNLPQAVNALAPQQDAALQLTLAQGANADDAARRFFSQQGIRPGQGGRQNVNGNPAVVAYFQAQGQQGVITGTAAFIEHGGRTYQVLAYAPAQRFAQYEPAFRRVIFSFGDVADPSVLNVRPNRVDVVRTTRQMTLAEFNRQNPSVIPLAELAILNQVEGENAVLPAGSWKRVVAQ
ncbi:M48 family metalloprotease [Longimicrobium sp.]|uniref:M48 family metalloprotease n=1 Tax=Longimicrobium sp. TaxID=2029185 RepID=UPI002E34B26E|nr:M48 family metalloprotease [Longimicrobium sp.]HEX6037895.1 M48 family metalloprotease [Longimicrobium sp.]